jgi:hypothetical protein
MKKYLMTGIAAVAMCAAFTSCSKDKEFEQITPEQTVQANYDAAFIKAFGQPAANQTWGFGTNTTRAADVNGNQWHVEYNLEYDAPVTIAEMNKVFNYVNDKNNVVTVNQIPYTDYWVSQIWNGKNDANASGVKAPATETYPDQNGAKTTIIGGGQMDKLMIKESANGDWIHCNNFNAADNNNWNENGEGGRTLMKSSGTYSFGYTNSDGSHFSTKYIIVPGEKIDASLKGFYYVCFDFEKGYTAEEQAAETSYGTCEVWKSQATDQNPDAGYWQGNENWNLPGFYNDASSAELKTILEAQKGTQVQNITFKGYKEGNHHCEGDDNYTDWIVRISPAKLKEVQYDGRIMAEDLSAAESGDFDFNDVVFDYKLNGNETADVKLRAAGGTIELYVGGEANGDKTAIIGGHEVHNAFGVGISTMVNTGAGVGTIDPEPFTVSCKDNEPINIKIWVKKGTTFMELNAHTGQPASKFKTETTTKWCDEYISIINPYPNFATWVGQPNVDWTTPFIEKYADKDLTNNSDAIKGRM